MYISKNATPVYDKIICRSKDGGYELQPVLIGYYEVKIRDCEEGDVGTPFNDKHFPSRYEELVRRNK